MGVLVLVRPVIYEQTSLIQHTVQPCPSLHTKSKILRNDLLGRRWSKSFINIIADVIARVRHTDAVRCSMNIFVAGGHYIHHPGHRRQQINTPVDCRLLHQRQTIFRFVKSIERYHRKNCYDVTSIL